MTTEPPDDARQRLRGLLATRPPRNGAYSTVIVDGRGASGKTTFGAWLGEGLRDFVIIHGDDYFEPNDDPVTWGDYNEERFDAEVLAPLRMGKRSISVRPYDHRLRRVGAPRITPVISGVIVERWLGFGLDVDWDLRIWVETPRSVCLDRGIERDASDELGDRVRRAWEQVWQPREDEYIAASRPGDIADFVVVGTQPFT